VECLVAVVLLAMASLALSAGAVGLASMGDDALQLALAQQEQTRVAERAFVAACDSAAPDAPTVRWLNGRHRVAEAGGRTGLLRHTLVEMTWVPSALAMPAARRLRVSTAARCR
jgi:hypothetical protein